MSASSAQRRRHAQQPVEQLEAKYPILFERFCLRTDSGGAGRIAAASAPSGGARARRSTSTPGRAHALHAMGHRRRHGRHGQRRHHARRRATDDDRPNAKSARTLKAGDALILRTGGGGGFGSPHERPAEVVATTCARATYRSRPPRTITALSSTRETLEVDDAATSAGARLMRTRRNLKEC